MANKPLEKIVSERRQKDCLLNDLENIYKCAEYPIYYQTDFTVSEMKDRLKRIREMAQAAIDRFEK